MVFLHAQEHHRSGYELPTRWSSVTDTHRSHKLKTVRSLHDRMWAGCWALSDDDHVATFTLDGQRLAIVDLFGVEDRGARDRLRLETMCQLFDELAPAGDLSSGIDEDSWTLGITSLRLATYKHISAAVMNYPARDHWTWRRWVEHPHPGSWYIRITPGERATSEQRAAWTQALEDQPEMLDRLVRGEPAEIPQGEQVAVGYRPHHVAREPLAVVPGVEIFLGEDSAPNAHTHATIIGQHVRGVARIYAGLVSQKTDLKWHIEAEVIPWLARRAAWSRASGAERLCHGYDPAMDPGEQWDIDQNPLERTRRMLGGSFVAGPVPWPSRIGPLTTLFNATDGYGGWALQIDPGPDTELLRRALSGRWYYARNAAGTVTRDLPFKPNHPWEDLGDGLCYLVGRMRPTRQPEKVDPRQRYAESARSAFDRPGDDQRFAVGAASAW